MILPRKVDLTEQIELLAQELRGHMDFRIQTLREFIQGFVKRLSDPRRKLRENQQRVDELSIDLMRRFQDRLRQCRDRLAERAGRLNALSPLAVLDRGYSITHKLPDERIVKDADSLQVGDRVRISFAKGKSICRVEEKE
jgi:exodeoxyribonuclease VII large subunit